jgi:hypothetical protein
VGAPSAGFDYELTPADQRRTAAVGEEILDHTFTIESDEPHVKVAWRGTALRDPADRP